MHFKLLYAKRWPHCLGLNVLTKSFQMYVRSDQEVSTYKDIGTQDTYKLLVNHGMMDTKYIEVIIFKTSNKTKQNKILLPVNHNRNTFYLSWKWENEIENVCHKEQCLFMSQYVPSSL